MESVRKASANSASTEPIVQHMYDYAHYRLKMRRVSPRTEPFLEKYRDTAKLILDNPLDLSTNTMLMIKLAAFNQVLHSKTILMKEPSIQEREGYQALKELVALRFLAELIQDKMDAEKHDHIKWLDGMHEKYPPATTLLSIKKAMKQRDTVDGNGVSHRKRGKAHRNGPRQRLLQHTKVC